MNKHTPGPWKAVELEIPVGFARFEIHYSEDGECVAEVVHQEANAKLIAAAPDLLEALQAAYAKFSAFGFIWEGRETTEGQILLCNMRDAIEKATGVNPQK